MKLAWFSPMPPARTGIATYSSELLPALTQHFDITVFAPSTAHGAPDGVRVVDFASYPEVLKTLPNFDRVVYHLGNNPWFHLAIFRIFLLHPGPVVLHDTVLYYLAAGGGLGCLLKELLLADPASGVGEFRDIWNASPGHDPLRLPTPSQYPCLSRVLALAPMIIVHNASAARTIAACGYSGRTVVIPMPHYLAASGSRLDDDSLSVRRRYGLGAGDVVFGAFGFIGPTKRLDKVLAAFGRIAASENASNARLLIVGEGLDVSPLIASNCLADRVIMVGYVSDDEFRKLLGAVDVVINLRYPSHGESSATLIQAMSLGRPCLVTRDASFMELPDNAVVKVSSGESEVDEIEDAILRLAREADERRRIGEAAEAYAKANHGLGRVAQHYHESLVGATPDHWEQSRNSRASATTDYFLRRIEDLLP